jgi:hypothetical protein
VGPTCQLGAERWGRFPAMETETGQGASAACGPVVPARKVAAQEGVGRRGRLG